MKNVSKLLALLLVLAMALTFVACKDSTETGGSEASSSTTEPTSEEISNSEPIISSEPETSSDLTGTEISSGVSETGTVPSSVPVSGSTIASSGPSVVNTTVPTAVTLNGKEALDLFNAATKKVVAEKAGYTKKTYTKITKIDFGALGNLSIVKDAVYGFFNVGSNGEGTNEFGGPIKKGSADAAKRMKASTFTTGDIKSATAVPDGKGGYTITILVKDGSTEWQGTDRDDAGSGSEMSPIDKGPFQYGKDDDSSYDHKTAHNIYYSINHADDAQTKHIGENTFNVKFVAQVNAQGRMTSLTGHYDMHANVYNVKYTIITLNNKSGDGYCDVTYSNFQW
ncbi:MAG: hypothetical protein LBJ11_00450 [Oscillospiraceae bacterium]|nr:hypothetical protein [Oscillospiraceae bacterium]